ncbi:hypothetical protein UY3_06111, partial [Chelonia mydas]
QTRSSLLPISKQVERKYCVPAKGFEYLYSHPGPNSLVVSAANEEEQAGETQPNSQKQGWQEAGFIWQKKLFICQPPVMMANHQALLGRYDFNVWQSVAKFADSLPEDTSQEFLAILDEGRNVAKASLWAASDAVDSAARSITMAMSMRRASWLMSSGISTEAQQSIHNLPFDGLALFAEQRDTRLHGL